MRGRGRMVGRVWMKTNYASTLRCLAYFGAFILCIKKKLLVILLFIFTTYVGVSCTIEPFHFSFFLLSVLISLNSSKVSIYLNLDLSSILLNVQWRKEGRKEGRHTVLLGLHPR